MPKKMNPDHCPICGTLFTSVVCIGEDTDGMPSPGDAAMCKNCTAFLEYDDQLRVILMRNETIAELDDDIRLMLIRARHYYEAHPKAPVMESVDISDLKSES